MYISLNRLLDFFLRPHKVPRNSIIKVAMRCMQYVDKRLDRINGLESSFFNQKSTGPT